MVEMMHWQLSLPLLLLLPPSSDWPLRVGSPNWLWLRPPPLPLCRLQCLSVAVGAEPASREASAWGGHRFARNGEGRHSLHCCQGCLVIRIGTQRQTDTGTNRHTDNQTHKIIDSKHQTALQGSFNFSRTRGADDDHYHHYSWPMHFKYRVLLVLVDLVTQRN